MPSPRIPKDLKAGTYFLTITVKHAYYVLDRYHRWDILADSLKFFQERRSMQLHAFVFMTNHLHLIVTSPDVIAFVRDFKKYTARKILENIRQTEPQLLKLFVSHKGGFSFWSKTNMPELVESEKFFHQKANYILSNPVKRNYVLNLEDWYWSSGNPRCELKSTDLY